MLLKLLLVFRGSPYELVMDYFKWYITFIGIAHYLNGCAIDKQDSFLIKFEVFTKSDLSSLAEIQKLNIYSCDRSEQNCLTTLIIGGAGLLLKVFICGAE